MKTSVGIIGTGRFSQTLQAAFNKFPSDWDVNISGRESTNEQKHKVFNFEIIIPAIPISKFEKVIKQISLLIQNNNLVIDVCSVNLHPEKILLKYLNPSVDILSTHPLFGPDSTKKGKIFKDLKFVYHPTRIKDQMRLSKFLKLWIDLGCGLIEMTPKEHDLNAAYTHAYAFLIGKIGIQMKLNSQKFSTKGFENLMYNQKSVENDSSQLFDDMFRFNPYTKSMINKVKKEIIKIEKDIYE